jgi:hypothetical protein
MLHFELIRRRQTVESDFFNVPLSVGSPKSGNVLARVSPIGYAGKPSLPCTAMVQTKKSWRNCWYKACYLLETGATLGRLKFNAIDVVRNYV